MSKNADETIRRLEEFGLNEKEARVYLALLPYRDIGSSKLIRATGLHGQFVYNALERLEQLGLSKHVVQNGRKKFSANTPHRILSMMEEKKLSAQSVVRQLQEKFIGAHEQDFEIFQGDDAFIAHYYDMIEKTPPNSQLDVIAGPSERFLQTYGPEAEEFERCRAEKKLHVRYLGAESQRKRLKERLGEQKFWEYRVLPGHSFGLVNIEIFPDNLSINIWGNPIVIFSMTSKEVADGYREFFNALWNLSKK